MTPLTGAADPGAATPATDGHPHASRAPRRTPFLLLAGTVALLVPVVVAQGAIRDIDLYWHLLIGQEVLAGTPVSGAGHGWSFADVADTWVSTQWLAETFFAWLYSWGGLQSLLVFRALGVVAVLAVLALVTLRHRPSRAGVWPFLLGAVMLAIFVQERSQMLTYVLAPLVGWWLERFLREGRLPRWWIVLPLVVVWANTHGGWVLLPLCLGLGAVGRVADHGVRDRAALRGLVLAVGCVAVSVISPAGIGTPLSFLRFSSSTGAINEWRRVELWDWAMIPYLLLLGLVVWAWGRGRVRPERGEMLVAAGIVLFSLSAWRNVTPAMLILAPLVTGLLARALGDPDPSTEREPFVRTSITLGVVGALMAGVVAALQTPVVDPGLPGPLLAQIREAPGVQRVLNSYNVAGPLLWFGGRPPHVTVGIDGRADRYGGDYIARYQDALAARPGWQQVVDELKPTSALLTTGDALAGVLVAQRGWTQVGRSGDWVLLRAPDR